MPKGICVMANKTVFLRDPRSDRPLPRLPHPSWRKASAGAEGERGIVSADDFWRRLGL
jgi:hypothetical protein